MNETAAHEASHAVAGTALGLTPTCVSIRPQPGTSGHMHHGQAAFAALDREEPGIFGRLAVISLAGPLGAEWVRRGWYWSPFSGFDWMAAAGRMDLDRVELLADLHGGDIRGSSTAAVDGRPGARRTPSHSGRPGR